MSTKRNTRVSEEELRHTAVRMEQQQFSEVEVDKVVASANNMEMEEAENQVMVANPEQVSRSLA